MPARVVFLLLLSVGAGVTLYCHYCAGAETLPQFAQDALAKANISTETEFFNDCSSSTGANVCNDGAYCYKNAVIHKFNIGSLMGFTWTTYSKGCTNDRLDDSTKTIANGCEDLNSTIHETFTEAVRQCYCQGDRCNAGSPLPILTTLVLLGVFALLQ